MVPREKGFKLDTYQQWWDQMGFTDKEPPPVVSIEDQRVIAAKVMDKFLGKNPARVQIDERLGI